MRHRDSLSVEVPWIHGNFGDPEAGSKLHCSRCGGERPVNWDTPQEAIEQIVDDFTEAHRGCPFVVPPFSALATSVMPQMTLAEALAASAPVARWEDLQQHAAIQTRVAEMVYEGAVIRAVQEEAMDPTFSVLHCNDTGDTFQENFLETLIDLPAWRPL